MKPGSEKILYISKIFKRRLCGVKIKVAKYAVLRRRFPLRTEEIAAEEYPNCGFTLNLCPNAPGIKSGAETISQDRASI